MKKTIMSLAAAAAMSATAFGATASAKEIEVQKETRSGDFSKLRNEPQGLKKWNQLSSDLIFPGQKLNISSQEEKSEEKQYTVQPGDTLSKIAKEFGVTVSDLQKRNNLKSDLIIAGQTIAINGEAAAAAAPVKQESAPKQNDQPVNVQKEITVTATAYTANDGAFQASQNGVDLNANRNAKVIAVDPSVIPLGTKVYVEGYGEATAEDTGGAIKGHKIDVFIPDKKTLSIGASKP